MFFTNIFSPSPRFLVFFLLLFSLSPYSLFSQVSHGGRPLSFNQQLQSEIRTQILPAPDLPVIRSEDSENEKLGTPTRVGVSVRAGIDIFNIVNPDILTDGSRIWRIALKCDGALGLGLYFDEFRLDRGYRLFVYNESRDIMIGAFTFNNNNPDGFFATELVPGDNLVIEINAAPGSGDNSSCRLSEVSYVYRDLPDFLKSRGTADGCEVNINCPEGDNWQFQKHGVARIYCKVGGSYFWCTGSLVNNTLQNNAPFFLTADHCGENSSADDFLQWVFYFNYEAAGCENPTSTPQSNTISGSVRLANANTNGSDFLLLRLGDTVPEYYQPYFNGWSIENIPSPQGVTIHHPAGDIKKISSYTVPVQSSQWMGVPGTHWEVFWSETQSGWGVTEGGSSGSPLFDYSGKIIGTLTGGQAACEPDGSGSGTGPDKPDYYGKFSYSWDQNGSDSALQLKCWLDPINLGLTTLTGKNADLTAAFQASETLILTGNSIIFTNLSSGLPVSWEWTFEGGNPSSFSGPEPGDITYSNAGEYDVRLIVSNGLTEDTLHLTDFIHVVGEVYPNPTDGIVNIYLNEELPAPVLVQVYNLLGQPVYEEQIDEQTYKLITINLATLSSGVYTVRLTIKQRYLFARVLLR